MEAIQILRGVNDKQADAWDSVFTAYYSALCSYADRLIHDPIEAEDLVQNVLLYVWNSDRKFPELDELTYYLYRATYNQAMMKLRNEKCKNHHQRNIAAESDTEDSDFFTETVREELIRQLYLHIEELPEEQRKVINLSLEGLSGNEIADKLNISINTVKTHKSRIFKYLRGKMKDDIHVYWLAVFFS